MKQVETMDNLFLIVSAVKRARPDRFESAMKQVEIRATLYIYIITIAIDQQQI